jgi:hypothetical protein
MFRRFLNSLRMILKVRTATPGCSRPYHLRTTCPVHDLNINSPPQSRAGGPLEQRSNVFARELAAEAEAQAQTAADAEPEPAASGATPACGQPQQRGRRKTTVGLRTPAATDPLSMSRWTWRAPTRTRGRWRKARPGPAAGWRVACDGPERCRFRLRCVSEGVFARGEVEIREGGGDEGEPEAIAL